MGEEQLEQLVQNIQRLRAQGVSRRRIESRLRRLRDIPADNLDDVEAQAQAANLLGPGGFGQGTTGGRAQGGDQPAGQGGAEPSVPGAVGRSLLRGVSAGFSDEAAGLVGGTASALIPGGRGFSGGFQSAREHAKKVEERDREKISGPGATALDIVGSLLPGSAIFRGLQGAKFLKSLGPVARGAIAGGAEGGILGIGTGESAKERAIRGGVGAAVGAAGGGILGGRVASKAKPGAGNRLAREVEEATGLTGKPSRVRTDVAAKKSAARQELVRPLEAMGRETPAEITETVLSNPVLRREAERVAPKVVKAADEAGEAVKRFSFDELDTISRSIRNDASAFQKAAGSDLPANVRPVNVKKAEAALDELDDVMGKHLEDFPEFRARWAKQKARGRALIEGRKTFKSKVSDDFVSAFEKLDDPAAKRAFREGGATEMLARLRSLSEPKAVLRQLRQSPELRAKMRVILGGQDALDDFTTAVVREQRTRAGAHTFEGTMRFIKRKLIPAIGLGGGGLVGGEATGILDIF